MRWTVVFDAKTYERLSMEQTDGDVCGIVCEPNMLMVHVATQEEAEFIHFVVHDNGRVELKGKPEPEAEPEVMAEAEPEPEPEPME